MNIYLIPGLGADRRMYAPQLRIFPQAIVLEHLPAHRGEHLTDYARRFIPLIDTEQPFILIGTSLGGMVAMELSRWIHPEKIVLIASVKNRKELPLFIRAMKYLNLHRLISGNTFKRFNTLLIRRLINRNESSVANLIVQMTADASPEFIKWAIDAVIRWQPPCNVSQSVFHLHGTKDSLFPYSRIKDAIPIRNGSHVMNLTMSAEVNRILKSILSEETRQ